MVRRYQLAFAVVEGRLVLQEIVVGIDPADGPTLPRIHDRAPEITSNGHECRYSDVGLPIAYEGSITLTADFEWSVPKLFPMMTFPYQYERVLVLTFVGGEVRAERDDSERMARTRAAIMARFPKGAAPGDEEAFFTLAMGGVD